MSTPLSLSAFEVSGDGKSIVLTIKGKGDLPDGVEGVVTKGARTVTVLVSDNDTLFSIGAAIDISACRPAAPYAQFFDWFKNFSPVSLGGLLEEEAPPAEEPAAAEPEPKPKGKKAKKEPEPEPTPEPAAEPEPAPKAAKAKKAKAEPEPTPEPAPEPKAKGKKAAKAEPVPEPTPEPVAPKKGAKAKKVEPEPVPEPAKPAKAPKGKKAPEPEPTPAPEPKAAKGRKAKAEPTPEPKKAEKPAKAPKAAPEPKVKAEKAPKAAKAPKAEKPETVRSKGPTGPEVEPILKVTRQLVEKYGAVAVRRSLRRLIPEIERENGAARFENGKLRPVGFEAGKKVRTAKNSQKFGRYEVEVEFVEGPKGIGYKVVEITARSDRKTLQGKTFPDGKSLLTALIGAHPAGMTIHRFFDIAG